MIFDQHVHSNFSFDSNEDLENYINISGGNDIILIKLLEENFVYKKKCL